MKQKSKRKENGIMDKILLNHFPGWHFDLCYNPGDYYFVLSDDMDSFYSCRYLKKQTGIDIGGFYSFESGLYLSTDQDLTGKCPIYVDVTVVKDGIMCFDNHRSLCRNHMAINPNCITDRLSGLTYNQKYCGSTLMLVAALYGDPEKLSELEKEFLIAIDSFYVGYYRNNGAFRRINVNWLKLLGLDKVLLPILEKRNMQYFIDLISNYQLTEKIYINESGKLFTYADILPGDTFQLAIPVAKSFVSKSEMGKYPLADDKLFVSAEIYNGKYVINTIV